MTEEGTPFWGTLESETTSTQKTDKAQTGFGMPQEGTHVREKSGAETTSNPGKVVVEANKFEFPPTTYHRSETSEKGPRDVSLLQSRLADSSPLVKKGAGIALGLVAGIALIFVILVIIAISNIEFVNMSDEQDERMLWGSWWNPSDVMRFDSDGYVNESSGELIEWGWNVENLTLTHMIDGERYQSTWKYEITYIDTENDQFLFMASYAVENGTITNEIDANSCIAYVDSPRGLEQDYLERHKGMAPDWCDLSRLF